MMAVWVGVVAVLVIATLGILLVRARRAAGATGHDRSDAADAMSPRAEAIEAARAEAMTAARAETMTAARAEAIEAARAEVMDTARADVEAVRREAEARADRVVADARTEARRLADESSARQERARAELDARAAALDAVEDRLDARARREDERAAELDRALERAEAREARLDTARDDLVIRRDDLDARAAALADQVTELTRQRADVQRDRDGLTRELERRSGLSAEQARTELFTAVEADSRRDAAVLARRIETEARAEATEKARRVVVDAVQRVAGEQTAETVVSVLHLPADEMKGRIIGREGRNIRTFESVTGVNVIIDDTPEAVLLSCFDPVRREVARLTLDRLVSDGRIHPHRIEEAYELSKAEVDGLCLSAARDALVEVGIHDLDERLLPTLGRLKYRTSYGQNVLGHLLETAHIAGIMAAELGVEPTLVKRAAFLHDIGKALTHEVEGSHAVVGAALLRRYGESEAVAHAVEAHHNEVPPTTIEAVLTQASDTCSAARPGARRESLESYVKRLERIEQIASGRHGVEKVFAMQAGREVRVMVTPAEIDDLEAQVVAREIAKQIEDELTYPGQIRVTVVRETRASEIAH